MACQPNYPQSSYTLKNIGQWQENDIIIHVVAEAAKGVFL